MEKDILYGSFIQKLNPDRAFNKSHLHSLYGEIKLSTSYISPMSETLSFSEM